MSGEPFYITTAIDYVNGRPHLGHAYEKITADVIARRRRQEGRDVRFLTGTDEHGSKIEKTAAEQGMSPQAFVDSLVPAFEEAWAALGITHDRFIRTTDADHQQAVQALFAAMHDAGHLYTAEYEGWYCDGCEVYKTDKELVDGKCPIHPTRTPRRLKEENLFFRMSAFEGALRAHLDANPDWIEPATRRNEVLGMLEEGLVDVSVSRPRTSVSWGVPIPWKPDSVVYVWFDAVINYLTGAGYGTDAAMTERFWPCDVHIIGKDIIRFHCVLWPTMLMAAGIPLPRKVFAHGWVLTAGEKMSKSSGVVVEPVAIAERYGPDSLRWFLTSQIAYGRDGEFAWQRFEELYTAHLANGLGNLVSRTVGMSVKYFGAVPVSAGPDALLSELCAGAVAEAAEAFDAYRLHDAAAAAWKIVSTCNEQIQHREPWKMAKDEGRGQELADFLYGLLESIRIAAVLLEPVLPHKAREILAAIGLGDVEGQLRVEALAWGGLPGGTALDRPAPLFPRLDQLLAE